MSKGNGIDPKKAEPFIKRIEAIKADMASRTGSHMKACKELRDDIKEVVGEAKAAGIPSRALKGLIEFRELGKKQAAISDGFDMDESAAYEQLVERLGDFASFGLGEAAVKRAKGGSTESDAKH